MLAFWYSLLSVLFVSLVSLVGFFFIGFRLEKLRSITFILVSFAVGALFGDVFLHLIPEMSKNGFSARTGLSILLGLLVFFLVEKFLHWRHCHIETSEDHPHPLAMINLVGDGLHNFLDGVLIAASFAVNPVIGFSTTVAVFLHELPQEIGDFGILIHSGLTVKKALFFNFLSALAAILGMLLFFVFPASEHFSKYLIPMAAGSFLYLAGSDLVPELHKETDAKRSFLQLIALIAGVGIMYCLLFLE